MVSTTSHGGRPEVCPADSEEGSPPYLPTRGAVELMWASVGDYTVDTTALAMLGVWTVAMAALAAWAYRRDEGNRFS